MITKQGDVFDSDATYIAHGCNIDGVMGAGVAALVRTYYPRVYDAYRAACYSDRFHPGDCLAVEEDGTIILNLATQDRPGPHARIEWVEEALMRAAANVMTDRSPGESEVIAMPQIGAGIGGLDWSEVEAVVKGVESAYPAVQFEVWEYKGE